ncbi:MAG TPA: hypoxanthine phosphoribosyltransferase [Candidatus Cryosericum sp.]|jgi:hypoxanthine phosphoribosyltransferase|nr:hypoxanthine phosphoribosyltransferase [Candidatus Cryosericum sp.]
MDMNEDVLEVLVSAEEIQKRTAELGEQIGRDYGDRNPLLICVLRGAVVFLSDLMRSIPVHVMVDFMGVSSYGGTNMDSSGVIKITRDVDTNIAHHDVIIVEDIVDTGLTMKALVDLLNTRGPSSIAICTFLSKPQRRRVDVDIRYCGFEVPNKFVIGYGLDYDENYRNLPFVGVLKPEVYEKRKEEKG